MNEIEKKGKVEIVYEDEDIIAVVKPYGMIVNNADTSSKEFTLQDWTEEKLEIKNVNLKIDNTLISDFYNRSGIVHRLDKETSGILLIAKNEESFKNLQAQFKERKVEKCYVALCHGTFVQEGSISVPVGRLPWNRMRFGVVPDGRSAVTDFKMEQLYQNPDEKNGKLSLIKAFPKTGRTHQIRVHLQYAGFPIYSDVLYAGRRVARDDRKRLPRHFLHAKEISFFHPKTGEKMTLSSQLTKDLSDFLSSLTKINS